MPSSCAPAPEAGQAKLILNIDVWDTVFDQLSLLGYHKTLASCARLNKELAWMALRRLYAEPQTIWGEASTWEFWESLIFSTPLFLGGGGADQLLSHPYLNYVRSINTHNFRSALSPPNWEDEDTIIEPRNKRQASVLANIFSGATSRQTAQPNKWHSDLLGPRFIQGLVNLAEDRNLRVMLRELTASKWNDILPQILSCHEMERLSLDHIDNLDIQSAEMMTANLPKLRHLAFLRADDKHAHSFASFVSHLQPDQLYSFECSVKAVRFPVLRAIGKQTELRDLKLHFCIHPPMELHVLTQLTNLTSLTLKFNFFPSRTSKTQFREWVAENHTTIVDWLVSCKNLKSLHVFRMPLLIPAITDALEHLCLDRLHVFGTGCCGDFYRALKFQRLHYLFLAEALDSEIITPPLTRQERNYLIMEAVCAMPCLRDLRLHTWFSLGHQEVEEISLHVPELEVLSFVQQPGEEPVEMLRALEGFKHLTNLTVLGLTTFAAVDILQWIETTRCHLRLGGFSLSLPCQYTTSWFKRAGGSTWMVPAAARRDPPTKRIKELLRFVTIWITNRAEVGTTWRGNDYEGNEEQMFITLWGDMREPKASSMMARGRAFIFPQPGPTAAISMRIL